MDSSAIDERHRMELLSFLLVKTAAVRRGVKPGELLRVRHCYSKMNQDGLRMCLYRSDIYFILGLSYIELKVEDSSSLVLFYNPSVLASTLCEGRNRRWLSKLGYPKDCGTDRMLEELQRRFAGAEMPHEVGVFIGYPLKDVAGFMHRLPSTPAHNNPWRIYGSAQESLVKMRLYAEAEEEAKAILDSACGVDDFIEKISLKRAS